MKRKDTLRSSFYRGITKYVTTERGAGLALAYTVAAWYFWCRRGELPEANEAAPPAEVLSRRQEGE